MGSYLSLCIVTDMTLLYLMLPMIIFGSSEHSPAGAGRPPGVWTDVGPAQWTVGQHWSGVGLVSRVCWEGIHSVLVQCWSIYSALSRHCPDIGSILVFVILYWFYKSVWRDIRVRKSFCSGRPCRPTWDICMAGTQWTRSQTNLISEVHLQQKGDSSLIQKHPIPGKNESFSHILHT